MQHQSPANPRASVDVTSKPKTSQALSPSLYHRYMGKHDSMKFRDMTFVSSHDVPEPSHVVLSEMRTRKEAHARRRCRHAYLVVPYTGSCQCSHEAPVSLCVFGRSAHRLMRV